MGTASRWFRPDRRTGLDPARGRLLPGPGCAGATLFPSPPATTSPAAACTRPSTRSGPDPGRTTGSACTTSCASDTVVRCRTDSAVVLLHGDAWGFDAAFVPADRPGPIDAGVPGPPRRGRLGRRSGLDAGAVRRRRTSTSWPSGVSSTTSTTCPRPWPSHGAGVPAPAAATARSRSALGAEGRGSGTRCSARRRRSAATSVRSGSFISMENFYKTEDPVSRDAQCATADENDRPPGRRRLLQRLQRDRRHRSARGERPRR